jgi:hypothetical protein
MARVPVIGRLLDVAGLLLFASGGAVFARAWFGFDAVRDFQPSPGGPPWAAIRMADGYWRLQKVGVALMLVGVAVFLAAWWSARRPAASDGAVDPRA